jgi:hypothetical protein
MDCGAFHFARWIGWDEFVLVAEPGATGILQVTTIWK